MHDYGITFKEKAMKILAGIPTDELPWIINRFCGPSNCILSEKKFGCELNKEWVLEEQQRRLDEEVEKLLAE